ncbi:serine/threonine-protein kinase [Streptomyces sp. SL13]|uniref:non-specific serine/threonine protein kinase n=1 Tax=Streptantibioticus silvisoli TaxID=2705255 RepID=A0AA90H2A4_9ACTN|nr:serine/threonine-protein kinase [Streptantibioticus silvisoli]MDI5972084.1 serine/threonine-protein kinase [Streptantibioticus silvisoli]
MGDDNRLIRDRYRLIELIGRGGMGEVWRGQDEELGRKVAVKCLKQLGGGGDPQRLHIMRERFRREARVAAGLQHRGITVVHDFGADDGLLYLVMELLQGRTLSQVLEDEQGVALPLPDLADIGEQVAAALAYTHAQGVVHRDLKPANILRLSDGTVKICDFGIARLGHDAGFTSRLTGTGMAMGTPHYMSPEQIVGAEVDHRSDLYSFGCVLYELATGAPPFDLDDAWAVLIRHRTVAPDPPSTKRPELPAALDRLILELLAKEADDRPQDAAAIGRRLAAIRIELDRGSELPPWAKGLSTGAESVAVRRVRPYRPEAISLTGTWFTGTAPIASPVRPAPAPHTPPAAHTVAHYTAPLSAPTGPAAPGSRPAPPPASAARGATPPTVPQSAAAARFAARQRVAMELSAAGRWAEAVDAFRALIAERERVLGADHPDALAGRYELGFALGRSGRSREALTEYERVAAGRPADHPEALAARQETAHVLGQLGRHEEAHRVYQEVLAARERLMGADHPDTLRCRHNLAYNLGRLGRVEDAYRTAAEVYAARARVLGPDHPDTLVTRFELAYALSRLGHWEPALDQYRQVRRARAALLGPDHPDTLAAGYEVGICLGRLGRYPEALDTYRELAAAHRRTGGPDDPQALRARHGYGVNLGRLGRWEEALVEAREVCALRSRVLGADHPDTLVSRREVATALGWLTRWDQALGEYRAVAASRARTLGTRHADTLAAREDEAQCLQRLGRTDEADELTREIATLRGNPEPTT